MDVNNDDDTRDLIDFDPTFKWYRRIWGHLMKMPKKVYMLTGKNGKAIGTTIGLPTPEYIEKLKKEHPEHFEEDDNEQQ